MSRGPSRDQQYILNLIKDVKVIDIMHVARRLAKRKGADLYDIAPHNPSDPEIIPTYRVMRSLEKRRLIGTVMGIRPRHYIILENDTVAWDALKRLPTKLLLRGWIGVRIGSEIRVVSWKNTQEQAQARRVTDHENGSH